MTEKSDPWFLRWNQGGEIHGAMVKSQTHGECFSDTYCFNTVIVKIDTGPMFEMVTVPPVKCLDDRCISEEL